MFKTRRIDEERWNDVWLRQLQAVEGFVCRNLALCKRYLAWELVFLCYTVVNTLTIGLIGAARGDADMTLFLIVGGILWGFLSIIFHEVSESIAWERWEGTLEYTFMAPIYRLTHLGGLCAFAVLYGTLRTTVLLGATAFFFDLSLARADLLAASVVLVVSSLPFVGLGLVGAAMPVLSPEKGPQATHILQALILLVSGVYYETSVLPSWLRPFSKLSPATYTLRAMRGAILHGKSVMDLLPELGLLLLSGCVLIPVGLRIFLAAENWARRSGVLSRNG